MALASYNAGPGRIQQAINRNKAAGLPTDYWSLKLPQETMSYVPRFLAVAQIIKNPGSYGVSLPPIANRPHFREVPVGVASLNEIAAITGLSRAELYQLNPGHRGDHIDPASPRRILIPADLSPSVDEKLKKLSGSGGLWASNTSSLPRNTTTVVPTRAAPPELNMKTITPSKQTPPAVVSNQPATTVAKTTTPAKAASTPPVVTAAVSTATTANTVTQTTKKISTPKGSSALASFAAQSDLPIPSAPRIPVAVTPAAVSYTHLTLPTICSV